LAHSGLGLRERNPGIEAQRRLEVQTAGGLDLGGPVRHQELPVLHGGERFAERSTTRRTRRRRLQALSAQDAHVEVGTTWAIYKRMITAYRDPEKRNGRKTMQQLIADLAHGVPKALSEIVTLGRTLNKRSADVLAYFDRPGTSNGPTEATNGRVEHLRGSALGFRNLTNYIARCLLETGGFRPRLHPGS
jgi:transposase